MTQPPHTIPEIAKIEIAKIGNEFWFLLDGKKHSKVHPETISSIQKELQPKEPKVPIAVDPSVIPYKKTINNLLNTIPNFKP
jgi:hypothetical protein